MTVDYVKGQVLAIKKELHDDEIAHSLLEAIANGTCEDPAKCAEEALKTQAIQFSRWCA